MGFKILLPTIQEVEQVGGQYAAGENEAPALVGLHFVAVATEVLVSQAERQSHCGGEDEKEK